MSFLYLSVDQVEIIHDQQVKQYGGNPGYTLNGRGLLESALEQPSIEVFGVEPHHTLELKCAAYLYHISKNHAFLDGNKRTALQTMLIFLSINGMSIDATDDELFDLVIQCVADSLSKDNISDWLSARLVQS